MFNVLQIVNVLNLKLVVKNLFVLMKKVLMMGKIKNKIKIIVVF